MPKTKTLDYSNCPLLLELHEDFGALSENQSRQKQKSSLFDEKKALELLSPLSRHEDKLDIRENKSILGTDPF